MIGTIVFCSQGPLRMTVNNDIDDDSATKHSNSHTTSCKVMREEHGLSFLAPVTKCCRRFFFQLVRYIPERPGREPACVVDCGGFVVTTVVTGPNPQMQTGKVWAHTHWWTYQRHCGIAGDRVTSGRTGGIVGMLGTALLVDVPAALWERWGQCIDSHAGTPQSQNWRATDPSISGRQLVCVHRWFGVPCLLDWWTYQWYCASAGATVNTAECCHAGVPLAQCGHTGRGARWLVLVAEPANVFKETSWRPVRSVFDMPEIDFPFSSACESCHHRLQPSRCSRHLAAGVPAPAWQRLSTTGASRFLLLCFLQVPDRLFPCIAAVSDALTPSSLCKYNTS